MGFPKNVPFMTISIMKVKKKVIKPAGMTPFRIYFYNRRYIFRFSVLFDFIVTTR